MNTQIFIFLTSIHILWAYVTLLLICFDIYTMHWMKNKILFRCLIWPHLWLTNQRHLMEPILLLYLSALPLSHFPQQYVQLKKGLEMSNLLQSYCNLSLADYIKCLFNVCHCVVMILWHKIPINYMYFWHKLRPKVNIFSMYIHTEPLQTNIFSSWHSFRKANSKLVSSVACSQVTNNHISPPTPLQI